MPVADEELAGRAAQGDTSAFEELVERHQRYVFNLCLRTLGDYDLAAEVAQDAFLRAWRSIGSFRGESRFTTWLYAIAHNLSINRLASLRREARHRASQEETAADLPRLSSREEDPARQYEREEWRRRIHRQIDRLPDRYRTIITLFYLQELSHQEIAQVTGLPIGTIKTHLFRAKEMLRRAIDDEEPSGSAATDGVRGGDAEGNGGGAAGGASGLLRRLSAQARGLARTRGSPAILPDGGRAG